jgi:hypothetical protein
VAFRVCRVVGPGVRAVTLARRAGRVACAARGGHLARPYAGTEQVEFSCTDALRATMAIVGANMAPQTPVTA